MISTSRVTAFESGQEGLQTLQSHLVRLKRTCVAMLSLFKSHLECPTHGKTNGMKEPTSPIVLVKRYDWLLGKGGRIGRIQRRSYSRITVLVAE